MPAVLGIVTGLRFEADLIRAAAQRAGRPAPRLASAGLGAGRGAAAAAALIRQGATHLLSFGLAAGLDPALPAGAVLVAAEVRRAGQGTLIGDAAWADRLAALTGAPGGALAHADAILASPANKAALRAATGAAAADMESHGVATAAAAAGLPWMALRAISDAAGEAVAPAALAAADEQGDIHIGAVLAALLRAPGQIGGLMALGRGTARARRSLRRLADLGLARGFLAEPGDE